MKTTITPAVLDIDAYWNMIQNEDIATRFSLYRTAPRPWEVRAFTSGYVNIIRANDLPVGLLAFRPTRDDASILRLEYWMLPDYRGTGIMRTAFIKALNQLERMHDWGSILATPYPVNARSIKFLERQGFVLQESGGKEDSNVVLIYTKQERRF